MTTSPVRRPRSKTLARRRPGLKPMARRSISMLIGAKQGNAKQREVVAVSDSARVALRAGETLRKQIETLRKQIERLPAKHYTLKVTPMSAMTPRPAMKPATIAAIEYGMAPKLARSAFISL